MVCTFLPRYFPRNRQAHAFRSVWIVGAGSGLGRALALKLSAEGAFVYLSGRTLSALEDTRRALSFPDHAAVIPVDVAAPDSTDMALARMFGPEAVGGAPDLALLLPALFRQDRYAPLSAGEIFAMDAVNLSGLHYAASECMRKMSNGTQGGMIALCASAAAYSGMPFARPYGPAKAAVIHLAECLYADAPKHVRVKVIVPGFIRTRITAGNDFPMPCLLEPEDAARRTLRGLRGYGFAVAYPRRFIWPLRCFAALPACVRLPLLRRAALKQERLKQERLRQEQLWQDKAGQDKAGQGKS